MNYTINLFLNNLKDFFLMVVINNLPNKVFYLLNLPALLCVVIQCLKNNNKKKVHLPREFFHYFSFLFINF